MIIFYKNANMLSLPYDTGIKVKKAEDGKIVSKPKIEYFNFIPGENTINKEIWLKIVEYNKEDMDYYRSILSIFQPKKDEKTGEEIGKEEEEIDINELNINDMLELVDNTMDRAKLDKYYRIEKGRKKSRNPVLRAISKRDKELEEIEAILNKE